MSSWLPSWLPSLPSLPSTSYFSLPSSIQGRFISFILKRCLGHLLKPGQLDPHQIDSQVGSGYIQVNDVELDTNAVNDLLTGLPVELVEGSAASVTARIPLPNPLTATIGFSLTALHLIFRIRPIERVTPLHHEVNLSDSVASYAESFIHDELNTAEEATLKRSFRQEFDDQVEEDDHVPGGINPFLQNPEEAEISDTDPEGISIFAILIERLLARFECDATDTKITIIHPGCSRTTMSISDIRYRTEVREEENERGQVSDDSRGEKRTVSISGVTLRIHDLQTKEPITRSSSFSQSKTETPPSPTSSESSMDDNAQWAMSQSLAFLPPRAPSPESSVSGSMYQSAISTQSSSTETADTVEPQPTEPPMELKEDLVLSFGTEPLLIQLTTPPLSTLHTGKAFTDAVRLSVKVGVIRAALRAWHIRSMVQLVDAFKPPSTPKSSTKEASQASASYGGVEIQVSVDVGGFVMVLLPRPIERSDDSPALERFFAHPLVPPHLSQGYIRLHIDTITSTTTISPSKAISMSSILSISDLSLFSFQLIARSEDTQKHIAIPLFITDRLLSSQYSSSHRHPGSPLGSDESVEMPMFEVVDWTSEENYHSGVKLSHWRVKQKQPAVRRSSASSAHVGITPAVSLSFNKKLRNSVQVSEIEVKTTSFHAFVDIRAVGAENGVLAFFDDIKSALSSSPQDSPPDTPIATGRGQGQGPTSMLQSQVLKELDLDLNYLEEYRSREPKRTAMKSKKHIEEPTLAVKVTIPMIRVQARCPPAPGKQPRSGALVVDLHDINLSMGEKSSGPKGTSFGQKTQAHALEGNVALSTEFGRILVSLARSGSEIAIGILSLGPLLRSDSVEGSQILAEEIKPQVALTQSIPRKTDASVTSTLNLILPSVIANVSKEIVDGLQYWADDVSQTLQNSFDNGKQADFGSRDTSIIGSKYFVASRAGSGDGSTFEANEKKDDVAVKVVIHETFIRILLPRKQSPGSPTVPFDVLASDVDVLVEVKPEGKDQMVITLAVMELSVRNHASAPQNVTLLSLSSPRNLLVASKPLLKLRFTSLTIPESTSKESRVRVSLWGFTFNFSPDISWITDLVAFASAPPGAFETVVPSERTKINLKIGNGSIKVTAPKHPGAFILHIGEVEFSTEISGSSTTNDLNFAVTSVAFLAIDDVADVNPSASSEGLALWVKRGYALLTEIKGLQLGIHSNKDPATPDTKILVDGLRLRLHLCADTMSAVTVFISDLVSAFSPEVKDQRPKPKRRPKVISHEQTEPNENMLSSVDDLAFKRVPQIGPAPDMIYDDLPTNPDYLDESFGAAAGLREMRDEDLDDFDDNDIVPSTSGDVPGLVSKVGGETIRMLRPEGLRIVDNYFENLPPETTNEPAKDTTLQVNIRNTDVNVFLYDGYDWVYTRKTIENEMKEMRKRLAKIRQLVASGQTQDPDAEETSALLFNSVYIGLQHDVNDLEPNDLVAAIDEELQEDAETATQSSWQSLPPPAPGKQNTLSTRATGRRLTRSKGPSIEFHASGLNTVFDQYPPKEEMISKVFVTIENLEILDHIKTSTWKKFLTALRSDSRGNIRETGSSMVKLELRTLRPVPDDPSEENRLRAKILPLRLHVDQDALDFLKKFFSFKDPRDVTPPGDPDDGIYFQLAEIFPVDLKLDYKPRRVDYRALREGRTIELMNFFHFDGAEMTLRHITLSGITGWPRLGELLNDLWTPDVKATQLVDVISGVSPIRSVVNVGSGIADLVLLPISQYKKDGRIVRGVQKGTTAFVKSTATEAIKLGARLATGTQVILEHAEGVLGNEFRQPITAETLQLPNTGEYVSTLDPEEFSEEDLDLISKYAEQPMNVKEGIQSAYKSLQRNLNSAAQTILAVPMEVYERSGNEGPVRSVIRAVPIAVLKPMIGASEAVSKTLLGLHNSMDPNLRHDYDAKYKHR
ncbi:autophagy-related protein 2 [Paramarasmius palmivorus]|uniref:Autophagy-related protein 2 n=1 Tax=Paramarasmius palmivorus TaxID=297713 RepID=A0AAW0DQ11_9AGAR